MREWTIRALDDAYVSGAVTPHEVVAGYLARIAEIDRSGPAIHAVIETNPDALPTAQRHAWEIADEQSVAAGGQSRPDQGLLKGVPVLLKDNIDTNDRMRTTAGSLALQDAPTPDDAFLVTRLRAQGAVVLGKTNLSEWANFRASRSNSGWSSRGGQTRNPYVLDRTPCGSSSGSGAAIAANLAVVAVGTETDGSVTCPAAHNSLVGLKPSVGLVSRSGIIPISASQDTAGPMARTVKDATILLQAMAGPDPRDGATTGQTPAPDFLSGLNPGALEGRRIGVTRPELVRTRRHRELASVYGQTLTAIEAAGATLVEVEMPDLTEASAHERTVLRYEFKDGLERYLQARGGSLLTLESIVRFNEANAESVLRLFGQEQMEASMKCGPLTDEEYLTARAESLRIAGEEGLFRVLGEHRLDAIVGPTNGPAWIIDHLVGDYYSGGNMSSAPAITGAPHLTIPMGYTQGLPLGLSLVGARGRDGDLLSMGYALETRLKARRPPEFLPSVGLMAQGI